MDTVLEFLGKYKYLAMFGILFLCGIGLPVPEEVTLVGSGLFVGWGEAGFLWSSVACVVGILAGDSIIFGLGYCFGGRFLESRPMRLLLSPRRQHKVGAFFSRHGNKAVFFARFFAGVRIGVYAYAGSQRMGWFRFLFLDFLGAMISGPTSILAGAWAAKTFAENKEEAAERALDLVHRAGAWVLAAIVLAVALMVAWTILRRRRSSKALPLPAANAPPRAAIASPPGAAEADAAERRDHSLAE